MRGKVCEAPLLFNAPDALHRRLETVVAELLVLDVLELRRQLFKTGLVWRLFRPTALVKPIPTARLMP